MDMHNPPAWRQRVLAGINGHGWDTGTFYPEGLRLFSAWATAEGGDAGWNPLNCTMRLPGSKAYNTTGVQSYFRPTEGVCATILTLVNGNYNGILGDLQNGTKTAEQIVNDRRAQFSLWGTNPDTILAVLAS
jgi:hypothetical protein